MPANFNGLEVIIPSSVEKVGTGSTATIGANGKVTFSACTSLILNGVFSSTYDNYMVVTRLNSSTAGYFRLKLRAGTTTSETGYTWQRIEGWNGTSFTIDRASHTGAIQAYNTVGSNNGVNSYIFGPNLAAPTAFLTIAVNGYLDASTTNYVNTHSVSTSYTALVMDDYYGYALTGESTVYGFTQ